MDREAILSSAFCEASVSEIRTDKDSVRKKSHASILFQNLETTTNQPRKKQ